MGVNVPGHLLSFRDFEEMRTYPMDMGYVSGKDLSLEKNMLRLNNWGVNNNDVSEAS